jgi:murein DD-endopeptidase MepM/ murein hydrolase activator NlpD
LPNQKNYSKMILNTKQKQKITILSALVFNQASAFKVHLEESKASTPSSISKIDQKNQFETLKNDAQYQISQLQGTISTIVKKFTDSKEQKTKLSEQVQEIKNQIDTIEKVILDAKVLSGKIELKIQSSAAEFSRLEIDLKSIMKSLQSRQAISPLQSFMQAKSMGDGLSEMYSYYAMQIKAENLSTEIKSKIETLNQDLENKKVLEKNLTQNKLVLKSKESELKILLDQTQNDEDKYAELLNTLSVQKEQLGAELSTAQEGYLSHIDDFNLDDVIQKNQGYNAYCGFEDKTPLKVPADFFSKPVANSFIAGGFECDHDGLDIAAEMGSEIGSIADGTVEKVGSKVDGCVGFSCNGGYGNYVVIKHQLPFGETVYSLYGHMMTQSNLKAGDSINRGGLIGLMGCTGYTQPYPCGVHLHLMIFSDSYKTTGFGCRLGKSKCYDPSKYIRN